MHTNTGKHAFHPTIEAVVDCKHLIVVVALGKSTFFVVGLSFPSLLVTAWNGRPDCMLATNC